MIYFYDENVKHVLAFPNEHTLTFPNATMFTAYLDAYNRYDYVVHNQRLTATDVLRIETPWEITTYERNVLIYDEYGRMLDVRDFEPKPWYDYRPIYNEWMESQRKIVKRQKQGRTHERNGHYKSFDKLTTVSKRWNRERDEDCYEYATCIRHKSRWYDKRACSWADCFAPTENNWKEAKVRKQYMWHQNSHKSTSAIHSFKDNEVTT